MMSIRPAAGTPHGVPQALLLALVIVSLPASAVGADKDTSKWSAKAQVQKCQDCHADMAPDENLELPDGSTLPLLIDAKKWDASVHSGILTCQDCHTTIVDDPHPDHGMKTAREYQINAATSCRKCHYSHHTRMMDSVHFRELESGNTKAPTCVDCHGAHDVRPLSADRMDLEKRCARCHEDVSTQYLGSVHGQALAGDHAADVPVCTDCHGVHSMEDPRTASFHVRSHQVCARCHADPERMDRYGLSTNVVKSYLDDFHGASNLLYAQGGGTPDQPIATCVDCHGVHDIKRMEEAGGKEGMRARVATSCRRCHSEVPDSFADAWLSHYEPTLATAPLVWGVTWVYRFMIPIILLGLILHILLDLWRVRTRRHQGGHS